jgi:GntR family transcriptional regulator, rspAB operon transcriptional repressor
MAISIIKNKTTKSEEWLRSDQIFPPKSISDQIYDLLKKKILENEIKPGERLTQEEIAKVFNASRTPIRQAFILLEKDGLVERLLQGGVRVTQIDIETVKDVFGIRGVLEAYAVELACEKIQGPDIDKLREIEKQASAILVTPSVDNENKLQKLIELNSSFHEIIYTSTGSPFLATLINNLKSVVLRLRALSLREVNTWNQVWKEHSQLIDCLERRDKENAYMIMRDHISAAASYVLAAFQIEDYGDTAK